MDGPRGMALEDALKGYFNRPVRVVQARRLNGDWSVLAAVLVTRGDDPVKTKKLFPAAYRVRVGADRTVQDAYRLERALPLEKGARALIELEAELKGTTPRAWTHSTRVQFWPRAG